MNLQRITARRNIQAENFVSMYDTSRHVYRTTQKKWYENFLKYFCLQKKIINTIIFSFIRFFTNSILQHL